MTPDEERPTRAAVDNASRRIFVLMIVPAFDAATFSVTAILPSAGAGRTSATQDEVSWTMTFYILATAVTMPMTGWVVARFGRGRVQFWSLAGFTAAVGCAGVPPRSKAWCRGA